MKKSLLLIAIVALATLCGCRREDIREFTVQLPSLKESDRQKVVDAFVFHGPENRTRVCDGIYPDSFKFDFSEKTLTMRYDSMKIAQTNIRMLIQDAGVEVLFPSNTTGVAGYLDVKPKSAE